MVPHDFQHRSFPSRFCGSSSRRTHANNQPRRHCPLRASLLLRARLQPPACMPSVNPSGRRGRLIVVHVARLVGFAAEQLVDHGARLRDLAQLLPRALLRDDARPRVHGQQHRPRPQRLVRPRRVPVRAVAQHHGAAATGDDVRVFVATGARRAQRPKVFVDKRTSQQEQGRKFDERGRDSSHRPEHSRHEAKHETPHHYTTGETQPARSVLAGTATLQPQVQRNTTVRDVAGRVPADRRRVRAQRRVRQNRILHAQTRQASPLTSSNAECASKWYINTHLRCSCTPAARDSEPSTSALPVQPRCKENFQITLLGL